MEETYESIYRSCFPKLVIYLQQHTHSLHDAEDIASRAMLLLWNKWDTLPTHSYKGILCWLISTARNLSMEEIRKQSKHPTVISLDNLPPGMLPEAPPDLSPEEAETEYRERLQELAEKLPPPEAELLHDKIVRGMSDEELAAHLGISVNAVHIRWSRTKKRIATLMNVRVETKKKKKKKKM